MHSKPGARLDFCTGGLVGFWRVRQNIINLLCVACCVLVCTYICNTQSGRNRVSKGQLLVFALGPPKGVNLAMYNDKYAKE